MLRSGADGNFLLVYGPQQKNRVEIEHDVERWSDMSEKDYVLGTHDEELLRLGLQHRVWRPVVLDCWQKAGITAGKRILDLGAGPGYAALDLAEIVGPSGVVVALERSGNFVTAMRESFRRRGLTNTEIYELDLMTGDLPKGNYDFSWCRWVLSFVNDQGLLIKKLGDVMPKGGISIFHEYAHYASRAENRMALPICRRCSCKMGLLFGRPRRIFFVYVRLTTCGSGR